MKHIIRTLGLEQIEAVHARGEDVAIIKKFNGSFDVVISRAFAELGKFLKIAAPYVKKDGMLLAMKGPKGIEEVRTLKRLNDMEYIEAKEVKLPFSDIATTILVFRKTA